MTTTKLERLEEERDEYKRLWEAAISQPPPLPEGWTLEHKAHIGFIAIREKGQPFEVYCDNSDNLVMRMTNADGWGEFEVRVYLPIVKALLTRLGSHPNSEI